VFNFQFVNIVKITIT